jgi:hypothetical protein
MARSATARVRRERGLVESSGAAPVKLDPPPARLARVEPGSNESPDSATYGRVLEWGANRLRPTVYWNRDLGEFNGGRDR